jgi:hypothetical protein
MVVLFGQADMLGNQQEDGSYQSEQTRNAKRYAP